MSIPAAFSPSRGRNRCGFTYTPSIPLSDEIIQECRERLTLNRPLEEGQGSQGTKAEGGNVKLARREQDNKLLLPLLKLCP